MPDTGMAVIDWVYSCLWRNVQQSLEGAQIYNKTKTRSEGNFYAIFFSRFAVKFINERYVYVLSVESYGTDRKVYYAGVL